MKRSATNRFIILFEHKNKNALTRKNPRQHQILNSADINNSGIEISSVENRDLKQAMHVISLATSMRFKFIKC